MIQINRELLLRLGLLDDRLLRRTEIEVLVVHAWLNGRDVFDGLLHRGLALLVDIGLAVHYTDVGRASGQLQQI